MIEIKYKKIGIRNKKMLYTLLPQIKILKVKALPMHKLPPEYTDNRKFYCYHSSTCIVINNPNTNTMYRLTEGEIYDETYLHETVKMLSKCGANLKKINDSRIRVVEI